MSRTNDNSPDQTIAPTAEDAAEGTEGTRLLVSRRAALGCMAGPAPAFYGPFPAACRARSG